VKIDFGPGYRLYCTRSGDTFIVLLVGGHKASQSSDTAAAQAMVKEL
jgi:putative addiction module killer protein